MWEELLNKIPLYALGIYAAFIAAEVGLSVAYNLRSEDKGGAHRRWPHEYSGWPLHPRFGTNGSCRQYHERVPGVLFLKKPGNQPHPD